MDTLETLDQSKRESRSPPFAPFSSRSGRQLSRGGNSASRQPRIGVDPGNGTLGCNADLFVQRPRPARCEVNPGILEHGIRRRLRRPGVAEKPDLPVALERAAARRDSPCLCDGPVDGQLDLVRFEVLIVFDRYRLTGRQGEIVCIVSRGDRCASVVLDTEKLEPRTACPVMQNHCAPCRGLSEQLDKLASPIGRGVERNACLALHPGRVRERVGRVEKSRCVQHDGIGRNSGFRHGESAAGQELPPAPPLPGRAPPRAPCIRNTLQPPTAGARQGRPVRFDFAVHLGAAFARCMGSASCFFPAPPIKIEGLGYA